MVLLPQLLCVQASAAGGRAPTRPSRCAQAHGNRLLSSLMPYGLYAAETTVCLHSCCSWSEVELLKATT
jgi:hypothetical protein